VANWKLFILETNP